jgi:hypothetical protein
MSESLGSVWSFLRRLDGGRGGGARSPVVVLANPAAGTYHP